MNNPIEPSPISESQKLDFRGIIAHSQQLPFDVITPRTSTPRSESTSPSITVVQNSIRLAFNLNNYRNNLGDDGIPVTIVYNKQETLINANRYRSYLRALITQSQRNPSPHETDGIDHQNFYSTLSLPSSPSTQIQNPTRITFSAGFISAHTDGFETPTNSPRTQLANSLRDLGVNKNSGDRQFRTV